MSIELKKYNVSINMNAWINCEIIAKDEEEAQNIINNILRVEEYGLSDENTTIGLEIDEDNLPEEYSALCFENRENPFEVTGFDCDAYCQSLDICDFTIEEKETIKAEYSVGELGDVEDVWLDEWIDNLDENKAIEIFNNWCKKEENLNIVISACQEYITENLYMTDEEVSEQYSTIEEIEAEFNLYEIAFEDCKDDFYDGIKFMPECKEYLEKCFAEGYDYTFVEKAEKETNNSKEAEEAER